MAEKTIRSHRERVKEANNTIKYHPYYKTNNISIIDREAFVEYYLLEDIVKLYTQRLDREQKRVTYGRLGEKSRITNIEKFSAIIDIFNAAADVAIGEINSGNYKKVWKAIPEGALMVAAGNTKNLYKLKDMAIELLRELSKDRTDAQETVQKMNEDADALDAHEANVRKVKGLPTVEDIEEVIRAAELAIPDKKVKSRLNNNI